MSAPGKQHAYDALFFNYIEQGAVRSARAIAPLMIRSLGVSSVLDVGCGVGAWLSVYREEGVRDLLGVDGAYVDRTRLLVPADQFDARDVAQPFDLDRRFDLVQSLEVAEHLPPDASRVLIANLVRHGPRVLFSAAVPGQGGEHHVNEQTHEFWRRRFAEHGYRPFDFVRPRVAQHAGVERWYAYNTILYLHEATLDTLPAEVARTRVPDGVRIRNVAPALYRLRTALLRPLPVSIVTRLAVLKHRVSLARRPRS